jgi:hypothetical protein
MAAMADVVFFPRFVLGRTGFGTAVYWDSQLGLLIRTEDSPSMRAATPDEVRRCYPEIWVGWVRFASLFPQVSLLPGPVGPDGRVA